MIKSVTVTNNLGESIVLELRFPEKSGFLIKEGGITGLGPAKATINSTESVTVDGASFNSAHVGQRNIVFNFLNANVLFVVPGRHCAPLILCAGHGGSLLHGTGVRTGLLIGQQGHRRHRIRSVAVLATLLQQRGDVLSEGNLRLCRLRHQR